MKDSKKQYLDSYVIQAKIGSKAHFQVLYNCHELILDEIFESYRTIYKFLNGQEFDVYRKFYIFFWEGISAYRIDSDISFSKHIKNFFIDKMNHIIEVDYRMPNNLLPRKILIEKMITNKKGMDIRIKRRKKIINCLRAMTTIQLKTFIYRTHKGWTHRKIKEEWGLHEDSVTHRIKGYRKKIRDLLYGVRTNNKGIKKYKRLYHIYKEEPQENQDELCKR